MRHRRTGVVVTLAVTLALGACSQAGKAVDIQRRSAVLQSKLAAMNAAMAGKFPNDPAFQKLPKDAPAGVGEMVCGGLMGSGTKESATRGLELLHLQPATLDALVAASVKYLCPESAGKVK